MVGALIDILNENLILGVTIILGAVCHVAIPWCQQLILMSIVTALKSFFNGGIDSGK